MLRYRERHKVVSDGFAPFRCTENASSTDVEVVRLYHTVRRDWGRRCQIETRIAAKRAYIQLRYCDTIGKCVVQ